MLEEFRDQLPPEIFTEPAWTPAGQRQEQTDRAAIRRASKLLDEAGWTVGPDGLRRNAAGETLTLEFVDDNPSFERVINPYVANLRRIGIDASYTPDRRRRRCSSARRTSTTTSCPAASSMSLSPSIELRQLFASDARRHPGLGQPLRASPTRWSTR